MTTSTDNLLPLNQDSEFEATKAKIRNFLTTRQQLDAWSPGAGADLIDALDNFECSASRDRLKGMIADLIGELTVAQDDLRDARHDVARATNLLDRMEEERDRAQFAYELLGAIAHTQSLVEGNLGFAQQDAVAIPFFANHAEKRQVKALRKLDEYLNEMFYVARYDFRYSGVEEPTKKLVRFLEKALDHAIENRDDLRYEGIIESLWSIEDILVPLENREAELERKVERLESLR